MFKLIRDKIPSIAESTGTPIKTYVATDEEYKLALFSKLLEEVEEWKEANDPEELADVITVITAILDNIPGYDWEKIKGIFNKKYTERGGFNDKIIGEFPDKTV